MRDATTRLSEILKRLESHYGVQQLSWPTDPYLFIIWWHCGYPASDERCAKGWAALNEQIGVTVDAILNAPTAKLAQALKHGGMVPELRAMRLKEIAARVSDDHGGNLRRALTGDPEKVKRALKQFPNIADPGAERIMLFADIAPVAAVPSNCPHVLVRIQHGRERENYGVTYGEAQEAIEVGTRADFDARRRAYLLLKRHGQEICKRTNPKCEQCPVSNMCAFYAGKQRGRSASAT
jgi:endonuclease-3